MEQTNDIINKNKLKTEFSLFVERMDIEEVEFWLSLFENDKNMTLKENEK